MTTGRQAETAREGAARLILAVTAEGRALSDAAPAILSPLAPADRARAQRLALSTLRRLSPADKMLKPHLRRPPPPEVLAVLRLATVEILTEAAPPAAVVHEAVNLARRLLPEAPAFAGLVNAVLRKIASADPAAFARLDPQPLPGWLRGRLQSAYGKAAVIGIEAAHQRGATIDLTPRDGDGAALAERVGVVLLPTGSVRLPQGAQVSELPGYAEGAFWVQDAAAALAVRALAPKPGERILDLCAAPGGKTLQLAAAGAEVTAVDLSAERMARVTDNLARTGLRARTVVADALTFDDGAPWDAILLDAPCSATGTIRRHPDLPLLRDAAGIKPLAALQAALIDRAVALLAPGGRLVFATCSLLPDEGEAQAAAALARHPDLRAAPIALTGLDPAWVRDGALRLRPDYWPAEGGMDGFFIAAFSKDRP